MPNAICINISCGIQNFRMMHENKSIYMYFCTCNSIHVGECVCTQGRWVGCAPDAWLTGPSKNGADINRLGRSHVSVYTGRPQSSTTRALESLRTANSHTIYLCLIQKHLLISTHMQHMGMQIQCMCIYAEMQPCTFLSLILSPTQYCRCLFSFTLLLSFRPFSS